MKKTLSLLLILLLALTSVFAQPVNETTEKETIKFTDSAGRIVEIPAAIEKVVPSGR